MKRKLPGERVERFRERTAIEQTRPLIEQIQAWSAAVEDDLAAAEPALPDELGDRAAEAWEPLFAIAGDAGEQWPRLARAAAVELSGQPDDYDGGSVQRRLLAAIRSVWPDDEDRLSSADVCARLNLNDELPYSGWSDGRGINPGSLARYLKPYGIKSGVVRIGDATPRGFKREDFSEAWERYLPPGRANVAPVADVAANSGKSDWGVA